LTPRAEGHPLTLLFTTTLHGFSLATLFRKNSCLPLDTPILLCIQDTNLNHFGALVSTPLRVSETFYGTGQSFLFKLQPFECFKWSGQNSYFVKSGLDGIAIGAGEGHFAIWLDADLNCGHTDSSLTYNNPPLSTTSDFQIKTLECWAFISSKQITESEFNSDE